MIFQELLKRPYVLLDGAMGTMLQNMDLPAGGRPELLGVEAPEKIVAIHRQYVESGANIVYTNTFGANRWKLAGSGYSVEEVIGAAVRNAKTACCGSEALAALDLGPTGQLLEPGGLLSFEEAYDSFAEQIVAGCQAGADVIVLETMTDLYELKAAVLAAKEHSSLPVLCSMTFEKNGRTYQGCSLSSMALTLEGLGVDVIGMNCSAGPQEMLPLAAELRRWTRLPLLAKPNAGLPDAATQAYDVSPVEFASYMRQLAESGVTFLGGCCGTTPAYLAETKKQLEERGAAVVSRQPQSRGAAVCSGNKTISLVSPCVAGARINPSGKPVLAKALEEKDWDTLLDLAYEQTDGGALLLDVNVHVAGIPEVPLLAQAVKELQATLSVPLLLDSTDSAALEAALRVYNGKPVVNSVGGDEQSLSSLLPLVRKYGAAMIGMTLDESGIPEKAEGRLRIAERILEQAQAYGICPEDVWIDCATLAAGVSFGSVRETLRAVRLVRERLGLTTVLGISNVSYGMPARSLLNRTYLAMALEAGADVILVNPNDTAIADTLQAYRALYGNVEDCLSFVERYQPQ